MINITVMWILNHLYKFSLSWVFKQDLLNLSSKQQVNWSQRKRQMISLRETDCCTQANMTLPTVEVWQTRTEMGYYNTRSIHSTTLNLVNLLHLLRNKDTHNKCNICFKRCAFLKNTSTRSMCGLKLCQAIFAKL